MFKRILTLLLCLSLLFVTAGCGNGNGVADEEKDTEEVVEKVEGSDEPAESETYTVGSTFEAEGVSLTLDSATYSSGDGTNTPPEGSQYILLNFTVQNNNSDDYEVSQIKFNTVIDGTETEALGIAPDYLETITVPANSDAAGALDYEVADGWTEIQTEVQISSETSQTATFTITPDQVS